MTNLEWMHLQHYERWRKRLLDDPYKTLFGASNDMLKGKGLGDWEWVYKTFPKWMLLEMDMQDKPHGTQKNRAEGSRYTGAAHRDNGIPRNKFSQRSRPEPTPPRAGEGGRGLFRQRDGTGGRQYDPQGHLFYARPAQMAKDESSGVVSPSDLRRPRVGSDVKVVGSAPDSSPAQDTVSASQQFSVNMPSQEPIAAETVPESEYDRMVAKFAARKEANARESSLINEFLNIGSPEKTPGTNTNDSNSWRQTALQRRAASNTIQKPQAQSSSLQSAEVDSLQPTQTPTVFKDNVSTETPPSKHEDWAGAWVLQEDTSITPNDADAIKSPASRRSPSEVLKQLPENDIDFLSAEDVRASMGAKRSRLPTDEQKLAERENLEQAFAATKDATIDSLKEAQIINDQHVRRTARQLLDPVSTSDATATPSWKEPVSTNGTTVAPAEESSVERITSWLQTRGVQFANMFWQDPTEDADLTKSKLYFDKAAGHLKKGQAAMRQANEDLEKDIPASKPLLTRLKDDVEVLDLSIFRLRKRDSSGHVQDMSPRKMKDMMSLKSRFERANHELEVAYNALREIAGTEAASNATGSFKRRLTTASEVLQKNAQLLRTLIWSLQARLEDPNIDRAILKNYKVVADNLLSLRDTEITLIRLVDRAMLVYGVETVSKEDVKMDKPDLEACEDPFVQARLAADMHLINEINAPKSPLPSAAEEAPVPTSRPSSSKVLDEPSPLTHSLFRPFAPAINSLGKCKEFDATFEKFNEAFEKKEKDFVLDMKSVGEMKQAYEDAYKRVHEKTTAERSQDTPAVENVNENEKHGVKKFEMLKEDPSSAGVESADNVGVMLHGTPGSRLSGSGAEVPVKVYNDKAMSTEDEAQLAAAGHTRNTSGTNKAKPKAPSASPISLLPTHYTILVRDPQTDSLSITTCTTGPPRDTAPALPLHQALVALESPAKFIPYITEGLEVVSAKQDMLVLRDAIDSTATVKPFETVATPSSPGNLFSFNHPYVGVNPIDGTTRLSPTGYVSPGDSRELTAKESKEQHDLAQTMQRMHGQSQKQESRRRRAGVFKTAIWVAGLCYVAGVVGEIAIGP